MAVYNVDGDTQERIARFAREEGINEGTALTGLVLLGFEMWRQLNEKNADYIEFSHKEMASVGRKLRSLEARN